MTDLRLAPLGLLVLFCACAAPLTEAHSRIDRRFATERPATIALRVEGPEGPAAELREALYSGLIAKNYSVLAPGEPVGTEAGIFRVRVSGDQPPFAAEATLASIGRRVIYETRVDDFPGDAAELATALLAELPTK